MVVGRALIVLGADLLLLIAGAAGAVLAISPARRLLSYAAAITTIATIVVGFTPLAAHLAAGLSRSDPLHRSDAIVVLASESSEGGGVGASGQERLLHAYALARAGWAPRLVVSAGSARWQSWIPAVSRQMIDLGLSAELIPTPSVETTHDEALAVAAMMRGYGWRQVILVTHDWHMPRAAAVFEKAGVRAICSPCADAGYDPRHVSSFGARMQAFNYWLHETLGTALYQWRGWI
jgi:uncharacterized SAM-binding protein YcdF (DUF218 family)